MPPAAPVPCRVAAAPPGCACHGLSCVAEPRINASEDVVLHVAGVAVTLQCNLTSSPSPLAASYWVKNGEEIPGTRKASNTTEYRWVAWGEQGDRGTARVLTVRAVGPGVAQVCWDLQLKLRKSRARWLNCKALLRVHVDKDTDSHRGFLCLGMCGFCPAHLLKDRSVAAHPSGAQNPGASWNRKWAGPGLPWGGEGWCS